MLRRLLLAVALMAPTTVVVVVVVATTGPVAGFGGAGLASGRGWHWPDLPLTTTLPPGALSTSISSSLLAAHGVGLSATGASWDASPADYRDVAALGLSLCTRGDAISCSPAVEGLFMDFVGTHVASFPATGLGKDVDTEVGLYPTASLACVLRVNQWAAGRSGAGAGGGAGGAEVGTPAGQALAAHYADLFRRLVVQGWIYMLRRAVPVARPYPFPKNPYLDMMRHTLVNFIYRDDAHHVLPPFDVVPFSEFDRGYGKNFPTVAHSMIGLVRMTNLQYVLEDVVASNVLGDFLEAGVWRGGACILAHAAFTFFDQPQRRVWVVDSFQGLPPPSDAFPADKGDRLHTVSHLLGVSVEQVAANFLRYGFDVRKEDTKDRIVFVKGFFNDTLPSIGVERLAILRLDGDMYQSTWETYQNLYSRVSVGGYTIVDDVPIWGSRAATLDFRAFFGLHKDPLVVIDEDGVYWRRSAGPTLVGQPSSKWPLYAQLMRSSTVVALVSGTPLLSNSPLALLTLDDKLMRATNATIVHWWNKPGWASVLSDPVAAATVCTATTTRFTPLEHPAGDFTNVANSPAATELGGLRAVVAAAEAQGRVVLDTLLLEYVEAAVVEAVAGLRVCQLGVKSVLPGRAEDAPWMPVLAAAGFTLAYEVDAGATPGGSVALLLNRAFCNPTWLATATHVPLHAPGGYRTGVVLVAPEWAPPHQVEQLVAQCLHHMRQPLGVAVVAPAHALGVGAPLAVLLNLARVYPGLVTVLPVPAPAPEGGARGDWEAAAWNAGVAWATGLGAGSAAAGLGQTLSPPADVVLLLTAGAVVGHDIVHLTDAASGDVGGTGPFFPATNAPRRGGPPSPQFMLPSTFEAAASSPRVVSSRATVALAATLGGRAWAFHAATLSRSVGASARAEPFSPHGAPFTSDQLWLEEWALGAASASWDRLVHVVQGTYVTFQTLMDVGVGPGSGSGPTEAPFPALSEVLIEV